MHEDNKQTAAAISLIEEVFGAVTIESDQSPASGEVAEADICLQKPFVIPAEDITD